MKAVVRALAAMLLVVAGIGSVAAGPVWWNSEFTVTRFEPQGGRLQTRQGVEPVRAVVPLVDGGAWALLGNLLMRLGTDLAAPAIVTVVLDPHGTPMLAADGATSEVWVAQDAWLRRYDAAGGLMAEWQHTAPVAALAFGGPDAVWIGDATRLHRYTSDGRPVSSSPLGGAADPARAAAIFPDPVGGYLWLLTKDAAVQYDVLGRLQERVRVALPPDTAAVAFDPSTGMLWLLSRHHLMAFDRGAQPQGPWPVPDGAVEAASALAVDAFPERLWLGDARGTTAFSRATLQWIRVTGGDATSAVAGGFRSVVPTIALSALAPKRSPGIAFQLGASCDGAPCRDASRYVRELAVSAMIGESDVTRYLTRDAEAGLASLREVEALATTVEPLRMAVTDSYGNRSAELALDLRTLVDESARAGGLGAKALPTVSITSPANNTSYAAPGTIAISATAADSDGTISRVEFYRDAVLLGTDTTAPYAYSWTNVAIGSYKLTAKAYDNAGGVTTSAIVTAQVKANVAPSVALTAPANNSAYTAPATIGLSATASDGDGTVTKVEFFQGTTRLNTDTTAPYAFTWNSVPGGTYTLSAKATDDKGAVKTSTTVTVKVNKPPTVALSAPANNAVLVSPANVTITASARDSDGTVSKVEFYRNGVLLGTDTSSPYSYSWTSVPVGTHVLTAKATDNLGAATVSAARTLTVNANAAPTVTLTSPAHGTALVQGVPVALAASASDADGTIANVKFYAQVPAYGNILLGTDPTSPYSINVPLYAGSNVLTAVATDNKGATATSAPVTVSVAANQDPSITLISPADGQSFPALTPPDITLAANATDADGTIASVRFYYLPAPTADNPDPARVLIGTRTAAPYQLVWPAVRATGTGFCDELGCSPDYYEVIAEATDNASGTALASAFITVPNFTPWTIQVASPQSAAVYRAPATMVLRATTPTRPVAGNPVLKVEFLADGIVIGTIAGPPNGGTDEYVHVWRNVGAGSRSITARLFDASGFMVESSPVTVSVRDSTQPPTVAVTSPVHGQTYLPTYLGYPSIPITAEAGDVDGTIAQVGIIVDDVTGFTGAGSPFSATWNQVREGLHVISASAKDDRLATSTARPVYIRVLAAPRLQAVVLTSPVPGAVTSPVMLAADVGAPEGGIDKVHFFSGSTLLGTVTTPPYRLSAPLANGAHAVKAVAVMHNNANMASTPVAVTVSGSNVLPSVSLTAPMAGQAFPVGSAVALAANATDADGTITKVEFFAAGMLVATDMSAPFTGTWTPTAAGNYALTAKATDNQGSTRISTAVTVTIGSNAPPLVSLTAPTSGQTFFAGVPIAISANASDAGGAIAMVEFFAGSTSIGTATAPPYAAAWTAAAAGGYVLTARATDNSGATTTSNGVNITVTANAIPTVSLSMPRDGQRFATGSTVNLIAAASDGDGPIARVEFYSGATLLGVATAAPYTFAWNNAGNGTYVLTARVIDTRGAVTISAPAAISIQPLALTVASPSTNAVVAADFVLVKGTFTAPANSGITVNGEVAFVDDQGNFAVNGVPLNPGTNSLEVVLTTLAGDTASRSISVASTGNAPYHVAAVPGEGPAPLQVALRYASPWGPPTGIQVSNLGSGVLDTSQSSADTIGIVTYATPGLYLPTVTFSYGGGLSYSQTVAINVVDATQIDGMFLGLIKDFLTALEGGNKALAMRQLSEELQSQFGPIVDVLLPAMAQIIPTIKGYGAIALDESVATYAVKRVTNGNTKIFLLDVMREADGVWRIDSF